MATLSPKQLNDLRHDLTSLADIKYDHLREELLDHYATLTEEKMVAGQSFYEASTAAWLAMGNGKGIQQIQDDYETVTKQQIKARHKEIMRSYLRWPTVVTTLLIGILLVYILLLLPLRPAKTLAVLLTTGSTIVVISAWIPYYRQKDSRQKLVWQYISPCANWSNILMQVINVVFPDNEPSHSHIYFLVAVSTVSLYVAVSLAQLTREHFHHKPLFS